MFNFIVKSLQIYISLLLPFDFLSFSLPSFPRWNGNKCCCCYHSRNVSRSSTSSCYAGHMKIKVTYILTMIFDQHDLTFSLFLYSTTKNEEQEQTDRKKKKNIHVFTSTWFFARVRSRSGWWWHESHRGTTNNKSNRTKRKALTTVARLVKNNFHSKLTDCQSNKYNSVAKWERLRERDNREWKASKRKKTWIRKHKKKIEIKKRKISHTILKEKGIHFRPHFSISQSKKKKTKIKWNKEKEINKTKLCVYIFFFQSH